MSAEEFKKAMEQIAADEADDDEELAHIHADELMCEVLNQLGYSEGVTIFKDMPKWYA